MIRLPKIHPNRAAMIAETKKVQVTLKRLPNVSSFEHADATRFNYFSKKLWEPIYEAAKQAGGYTVLFVPHYFDFIKIRTFIRNLNAQVCFISEYSEKKSCQRSRHFYESAQRPILVITERAIVFQKIRLRYARNIVLYGLPESQDTLTDCMAELFDSENWKPILNSKLNQVKL
jgi:hypothetical protein